MLALLQICSFLLTKNHIIFISKQTKYFRKSILNQSLITMDESYSSFFSQLVLPSVKEIDHVAYIRIMFIIQHMYLILNCNLEKSYCSNLMPMEFIFLILLQSNVVFFLFLFLPSCPSPANSPGTWASLVPFQVSNRTPILPANVQNYGLNIIGEPFLQAETSN